MPFDFPFDLFGVYVIWYSFQGIVIPNIFRFTLKIIWIVFRQYIFQRWQKVVDDDGWCMCISVADFGFFDLFVFKVCFVCLFVFYRLCVESGVDLCIVK